MKDIEETNEEENLITNKDSEKEYLLEALEEGDPEILVHVKYKALGKKQAKGEELTKDESAFMEEMNKLYALEKERLENEEQLRLQNEEEKKKVLKEYKEVKRLTPDKIDSVSKDETIRGGESIPKLLKFAFQMKMAKKKGGKVVVKVTRDKRVMIEWTMKDLAFVEFWTKDEKGNMIPEVTRFNEYKYNYEGSPIPVLFAIQGYAEGFDFFDEFRKDITSEMVSRIASRSYHAGYLEGVNLRDKQEKKGMFAGIEPFMPLITIVGFLIMIWLLYQMYGEITDMVKTVQALQAVVSSQSHNVAVMG